MRKSQGLFRHDPQCVDVSSGVSSSVTRTTSATVPSGNHDLRPRPLAITPTPSTPVAANRALHARTSQAPHNNTGRSPHSPHHRPPAAAPTPARPCGAATRSRPPSASASGVGHKSAAGQEQPRSTSSQNSFPSHFSDGPPGRRPRRCRYPPRPGRSEPHPLCLGHPQRSPLRAALHADPAGGRGPAGSGGSPLRESARQRSEARRDRAVPPGCPGPPGRAVGWSVRTAKLPDRCGSCPTSDFGSGRDP